MERTKIQNDQMIMLENEIYSNSIIPSKKNEMWRKIDLNGDVHIKGGIFGKYLEINAKNVLIEKAVFVIEGIKIKSESKGKVWINSVVSTENSIIIEESVRTRITSDVNAGTNKNQGRINISNAIIYGNIYCDEIILKNSIVLGSIIAKQKVLADNSIIGSYKTKHFSYKNNLGLIFPFSLSENKPEVNGKLFNVLASPFSTDKVDGLYEFDQSDFFPFSNIELFGNSTSGYLVSPSLRIFDISVYTNIMRENISKISLIINQKNGDIRKLETILTEFDNSFFKFIDRNFQYENVKYKSRFMDIKDENISGQLLVEDFVRSLTKNETLINTSQNNKIDISQNELFELPPDKSENYKLTTESPHLSSFDLYLPSAIRHSSHIYVNEILVNVGDSVEINQDILEIITNEEKFLIRSDKNGFIAKILVRKGDVVSLGQEIYKIDENVSDFSNQSFVIENEPKLNQDALYSRYSPYQDNQKKFCTKCGTPKKSENLKFCTKCGASLI